MTSEDKYNQIAIEHLCSRTRSWLTLMAGDPFTHTTESASNGYLYISGKPHAIKLTVQVFPISERGSLHKSSLQQPPATAQTYSRSSDMPSATGPASVAKLFRDFLKAAQERVSSLGTKRSGF